MRQNRMLLNMKMHRFHPASRNRLSGA